MNRRQCERGGAIERLVTEAGAVKPTEAKAVQMPSANSTRIPRIYHFGHAWKQGFLGYYQYTPSLSLWTYMEEGPLGIVREVVLEDVLDVFGVGCHYLLLPGDERRVRQRGTVLRTNTKTRNNRKEEFSLK